MVGGSLNLASSSARWFATVCAHLPRLVDQKLTTGSGEALCGRGPRRQTSSATRDPPVSLASSEDVWWVEPLKQHARVIRLQPHKGRDFVQSGAEPTSGYRVPLGLGDAQRVLELLLRLCRPPRKLEDQCQR